MKPNQDLVNNLLGELNKRWGLDCLNLEEDGRCFVRTDDHIELIIEVPEEVGQILLFAELEFLGHVNRQERIEFVMTANLGDPDLRLAHFGLDPATDLLYLTYHHPVEGMSVQFLENILVNFVQCARSAREKLQSLPAVAKSSDSFHADEIVPPQSDAHLRARYVSPQPDEALSTQEDNQRSSAAVTGVHKPAAGSFRR